MNRNLTEDETKTLHINNHISIIETCRQILLPFSVQSTAIIFYRKIFKTASLDQFDINLLKKAIILLACKCENVHGDFSFLFRSITANEKEAIFLYENNIAQMLKFNFHIPSPYLRIFGYIVIMQERGKLSIKSGNIDPKNISLDMQDPSYLDAESENKYNGKEPYVVDDVNVVWNRSVINMDKIMMCDEYDKWKVAECALASIEVPIELYKDFNREVDYNKVLYIRNCAKNIVFPDKEKVNEALLKLKNIQISK